MQILSPRKYVQFKVRSLPVCKCLVNADWEEIQIAHVTIMRQHTNGYVTIGVYTVDLLCLGIKDTVFFFNTSLDEFMQQYDRELTGFKEIDYNLAHNIVYAGHDFALEFDIRPHRDFEITRFILEEDNNAIPFIDVPVGVDGIPHLITTDAGEYADALAKLKQYAGEGNYYYSVDDSRNRRPADEGDDTAGVAMDDIPPGEVNLGNVQHIRSGDLLNVEKVQQRTLLEQLTIHAELLTRLLPADINTCTPEEDLLWYEMWDELGHSAAAINNVQEAHYSEHLKLTKQVDDLANALDRNVEQLRKQFEQEAMLLANQYAHNPLFMQAVYEQAILLDMEHLAEIAKQHALKIYTQYPVLHFSLALGALIQQTPDARFEDIYSQLDIREAVPGYQQYHTSEIINFWLIRLWICLEQRDLKSAVQYYYMLVDGKATGWLLLPVLEKYVEVLYLFKERL